MDVLHDRLIWQVLSGGHAFSPLRTDYRKTHASYPLGTASNPLGSAPAFFLPLFTVVRGMGILRSWLRKDQMSLFWRMTGSSRACYYERIRSGGSLGKEHAR